MSKPMIKWQDREALEPHAYRLARRDGELVLQGAYRWWRGMAEGADWRDIPTVDLDR